jgi:hypothetical protein
VLRATDCGIQFKRRKLLDIVLDEAYTSLNKKKKKTKKKKKVRMKHQLKTKKGNKL